MKNFLFLSALCTFSAFGQTNMQVSTLEVESIIRGDFNPIDYAASNPLNNPKDIFQGIQNEVDPDSLKAYIIKLASFGTRNTGSDTVSTTTGFGAARNWVLNKFGEFSAINENRLKPAFLTFDAAICGMDKHKNVLGVLPGSDTSNHAIIIIEGHMDSRCEDGCDVNCLAEGVEDNASGTALVIELARVMSKYSFPATIVFMTTTGEEQGLFGAAAMADYCENESINVRAVFNNDVIGGISCGQTSSPPSCPGVDDIDSLLKYASFLKEISILHTNNFHDLSNLSTKKSCCRWLPCQWRLQLCPRRTDQEEEVITFLFVKTDFQQCDLLLLTSTVMPQI